MRHSILIFYNGGEMNRSLCVFFFFFFFYLLTYWSIASQLTFGFLGFRKWGQAGKRPRLGGGEGQNGNKPPPPPPPRRCFGVFFFLLLHCLPKITGVNGRRDRILYLKFHWQSYKAASDFDFNLGRVMLYKSSNRAFTWTI